MPQKTFWSLIIGLMVVVTVVWVGYSLYEAQSGTKVSTQAIVRSKKISDSFDRELLDSIEEEINEQPIVPEGYHLLEERVPQSDEDIVEALEE